jgi:hypothetical protein
MGLLSTLEVEVLDRNEALHPGAARRGIGVRRVLQKSEKILQFFKKLGEGQSSPPPRLRLPRLDLLLDVRVCNRNFGDASSYRDRMHKEETDRQTFFFIYTDCLDFNNR